MARIEWVKQPIKTSQKMRGWTPHLSLVADASPRLALLAVPYTYEHLVAYSWASTHSYTLSHVDWLQGRSWEVNLLKMAARQVHDEDWLRLTPLWHRHLWRNGSQSDKRQGPSGITPSKRTTFSFMRASWPQSLIKFRQVALELGTCSQWPEGSQNFYLAPYACFLLQDNKGSLPACRLDSSVDSLAPKKTKIAINKSKSKSKWIASRVTCWVSFVEVGPQGSAQLRNDTSQHAECDILEQTSRKPTISVVSVQGATWSGHFGVQDWAEVKVRRWRSE